MWDSTPHSAVITWWSSLNQVSRLVLSFLICIMRLPNLLGFLWIWKMQATLCCCGSPGQHTLSFAAVGGQLLPSLLEGWKERLSEHSHIPFTPRGLEVNLVSDSQGFPWGWSRRGAWTHTQILRCLVWRGYTWEDVSDTFIGKHGGIRSSWVLSFNWNASSITQCFCYFW